MTVALFLFQLEYPLIHSVIYDPISAQFFPGGYDQNLTMEYESIQFI